MQKQIELSFDEFQAGRRAALANTESLIEDASLLVANRRWARSLFLSQIAGEEIGKYVLLVSACVDSILGSIQWKTFWQQFRSHHEKMSLMIYMERSFSPGEDVSEELRTVRSNARDLEAGKQLALYSDYAEGCFRTPDSCITEQMARNALSWAEGRLYLAKQIMEERVARLPHGVWTKEGMEQVRAAFRKFIEEEWERRERG